jgi:hypothetical protein
MKQLVNATVRVESIEGGEHEDAHIVITFAIVQNGGESAQYIARSALARRLANNIIAAADEADSWSVAT